MNSKRMYYLLLGVVGLLLVGVFAGTYEVNALLVSKSKHLVDLKLQSQVVASQQTGLLVAKKQVSQYAGLEQIAKTIVPQDKDQAEAVREIANIASSSGIKQLSSVTFPQSTLGTLLTNTSTSTSGTTTTNATPVANSSAKNALTQLIPVPGVSGVYQLQITIQQTAEHEVSYNQFLTFLEKLEQNRRTAQVSSILLQPDTKNPNQVAFTLILNEFIKP
jgi:hypothetical protein